MTEIANMGAGEQQPDLQSQKSVTATSINGKKVTNLHWRFKCLYDTIPKERKHRSEAT